MTFQLLSRFCDRLRRNDPSLTMLNLNYQSIGNDGCKDLANALKHNNVLVVLFLDGNDISTPGAQALAHSLEHHPSLEFVFLSYNYLGDAGAAALALALQTNNKIQVLKLADNQIGRMGAVALGESLRYNHHLKKLVLEGNFVGDRGAAAIAQSLAQNHSLTSLDLRSNRIRTHETLQGIFCESLQTNNKTLSELLFDEDNVKQVPIEKTLQFYLDLNRIGRHSFGACSVPTAVWTRVLASASAQPALLFAVLKARPDLLSYEPVSDLIRQLKRPRVC